MPNWIRVLGQVLTAVGLPTTMGVAGAAILLGGRKARRPRSNQII